MHTKYYNKANQEVPSVTTVLKILYKDGLLEWANAIGKRSIDYTNFLNARALFGTMVHGLIESNYNGKPYLTLPSREVDEAKDCVNRFMLCSDDIKITNAITELSLSCDTFGGTLDLLCDAEIAGQPVRLLGDFKTSKAVYLTHFIQLSAYLELLRLMMPEEFEKVNVCAIFSITRTKVIMRWLIRDDLLSRFTPMFYHLLTVYNAWQALKAIEKSEEIFKTKTY